MVSLEDFTEDMRSLQKQLFETKDDFHNDHRMEKTIDFSIVFSMR